MKVEIIAIGGELLDGTQADTNTSYIGSRLAALGAEMVRATVIPDDPQAIVEALERALEYADVVVATGGLGPTVGDRTKHVAARVLGRKLVLDESILARVRAHFEDRAEPMPAINVSQAMVPEGAKTIENTGGTAPGLLLEENGKLLFLLPGVRAEMRSMIGGYVVPFLEGRGLKRTTEQRLIRTTGLPESELAQRIGPTARKLARTDVAYLPSAAGVDLRIVCGGSTLAEASRTADRAVEIIAGKLGSFVYARGDESLEQVVGYLLTMARKTVAVAESCTAGGVGGKLTRIAGSSEYFEGGIIAYSNDVKRRLLGVKAGTLRTSGAVSAETAIEMARGVRRKVRADYGIGITGLAGPGGGSEEKPVGLVYIAVAWDGGERVTRSRFPGGRQAVRERAAQAALDALRRALLGIEETC